MPIIQKQDGSYWLVGADIARLVEEDRRYKEKLKALQEKAATLKQQREQVCHSPTPHS